MRRLLWPVAAIVAAASLTPVASAVIDPKGQGESGGYLEVEIGEGIAPHATPNELRQQLDAYQRSPVGREWLQSTEGKEWAGEVTRRLRQPALTRVKQPKLTKTTLRQLALDPPAGADWIPECADFNEEECFNNPDGWYEGEAGGADGYAYFASCKNPYVTTRFRNYFRHILWEYREGVNWCWQAGTITYTHRTIGVYVSPHWLNGWSFHGTVNSNCEGNCYGWWTGWQWAQMWAQGKFELCRLWRLGCRSRYPIVGIDFNGWGGWHGWVQ